MTSRLVQCAFSTERFLAHTVRLLLPLDSFGYLKSLLSHKGRCSQQCCFPSLGCTGVLVQRPVFCVWALTFNLQACFVLGLPRQTLQRSTETEHCGFAGLLKGATKPTLMALQSLQSLEEGKLLPSSRTWQPGLNHRNLTPAR